jgi:uncharacterized RmlC-like cupin family protein
MTMKTVTPTQEEMKSRIARFKELKPRGAHFEKEWGIPFEVIRLINPKANYVVMAPKSVGGHLSPSPAVVGGDKGVMRIGIAECTPGDGPALHVHWKTHETFMPLSGRWELQWGDEGQEKVVLEPFDLFAVPPAVTRRFVNVSDHDAHLLVIIQGQPEDFDDVGLSPAWGQKIVDKHGQAMLDKLIGHGWRFTLEAPDSEADRINAARA